MYRSNLPIFLASKSPRRKKLLDQINLRFEILNINLSENLISGENPIKTVKRIALEKMNEAEKKVDKGIIITADTIVVIDKEIIGKPNSKSSAKKILKKLSGKTHHVYTGYAVKNISSNTLILNYEKTAVKFRTLTNSEIEEYVQNGSPMDKAGAYGIQDDYGAVFVEKINGCYYNVVGLPISSVYKALMKVT